MNLLLDSQILIWTVRDPFRLPPKAKALISEADNSLFFSAASVWEVAIKHGRGRENFRFDPLEMRVRLLDRGYEEVAVTGEHAAAVAPLPPIHRDPFDRLLVAQAMVEGLTLLTTDRQLAAYPGPILRV